MRIRREFEEFHEYSVQTLFSIISSLRIVSDQTTRICRGFVENSSRIRRGFVEDSSKIRQRFVNDSSRIDREFEEFHEYSVQPLSSILSSPCMVSDQTTRGFVENSKNFTNNPSNRFSPLFPLPNSTGLFPGQRSHSQNPISAPKESKGPGLRAWLNRQSRSTPELRRRGVRNEIPGKI